MLRLHLLAAAVALLPACAGEPDAPPLDPPPAADSDPAPGIESDSGPDLLANPVTVRGLYLGAAFDSAAAVISHEEIPGVMGAMRMHLRVADPAELRGLREGDKIRFLLSDPGGSDYQVSGIEQLPPDTELALAQHGADAVPPEESLPDTTGSGP